MPIDREYAYQQSIDALKACASPAGFRAAAGSSKEDHYGRVFGRDSMICSLAALMTNDKMLHDQVKRSLKTLLKYQSKHGLIPSNVDAKNNKVSYGQSAGRIDGTLWFVIVFSQYIKRTKDFPLLFRYYRHIKKCLDLMHLYEFNERHLIYVPKGGDWADEYIQEGYVLYDQLLHLAAMSEHVYLRKRLGKPSAKYRNRRDQLRETLQINYWPVKQNQNSDDVYQKVLFNRALRKKKNPQHFLPFFNPSGYGVRFDGFANSLALLFGLADEKQRKAIVAYAAKNFSSKTKYLIPAFYPVIAPGQPDWEELKDSYLYKFSNKPGQYHNGGLWPMITGFYAAAIAKDEPELAERYLDGMHAANQQGRGRNRSWGFAEYHHLKTGAAMGTAMQAWSASAAIMAHHAIVDQKNVLL